jgi:tRNA (guanine37-N1)-methyltransferase
MNDTPDDPAIPIPPARSHGRLSMRASLAPRDLMAEVPQVRGAFEARVITLFPEAFPGTLGLSLTGRALDQGLWRLTPVALRPFGEGRHRNVDDTPAGGGAGMVLRADVVDRALAAAMQGAPDDRAVWPVIYLSPRGRPFDQATARRLAAGQGVTLLCGRFEGVDQRVLDARGIEEVSLGDFVLTGGEIAAQALLDAVVRLLPGVLGNASSAVEESFSDGLLEHPQYTRPAVWEGREIPPVLTGGNHAEVAKWRRAQSESLTAERRPDLWAAHQASHPPPPGRKARKG